MTDIAKRIEAARKDLAKAEAKVKEATVQVAFCTLIIERLKNREAADAEG